MSTTTATGSSTTSALSYNPNNKWYSENDMTNYAIEAFKKGVEHEKEQEKRKFEVGLKKAKQVCELLYHTLTISHGVKCKQIKLRGISDKRFEAIFIIPPKDYLNKQKFKQIHESAVKIYLDNQTESFDIKFGFMADSRKIDEDVFVLDGFAWTFGIIKPNESKTRTRKA